MSILNVDKIQPIGSGSTVTVNATDTILTNAQAGVITATKFVGPLEASSGSTGTFDSLTVTGNVGINENSPTGKLTITQDPQGFVDDSAQPQATFLIKHGTSGSNRRWVGIGASLTGAWIQSSSPGGTGLAAPLWINKGGGDVTLGNDKLLVKSGGSIGVNETTPDFSGFGGNGGGIELDDVNTGFSAVKLSQSGTDFYLVAHSGAAYISTRTNKAIVIEKNSTEVAQFNDNGLKFPNGKGIDFSSTGDGNGTMGNELLDDYEEGSWSPTIYGGTTAGSYSYQSNRTGGKYTKIGNLVYVEGVLRIESITSAGAGDLYMGGFPYATSAPMASAWVIGKGVQFLMYGTSGNTTASIAEPPFVGTATGGASAFNIRSYGKNLNVMPQIEDFDNQWWIFQVAGWYPVS